MGKTEYDYLIVGQGIAGTVLAHILRGREKKFMIIDKPELSACSKISAGLFNPVVLKRLTTSWMADELLQTLVPFYRGIEMVLGEQLLWERELVKLFSEEQEKALWNKKREEEVGKYLSPVMQEDIATSVNSPLGYALIKCAGSLDVQKFLSLSQRLFRAEAAISEEKFDHSAIVFQNGKISYKNLKAPKIIFCEGYFAAKNPFFKNLPFNPAKGELLTVRIKDYMVKRVINKGVFILPLGNDLYRVGATFSWNKIDDEITTAGREEMLGQLKKIIKNDFEVMDQKAGVRPALDDRRPVLGLHPQHPQLCIFNGMGSKGVMLAPYFAKQLVNYLEKGTTLNKEANIARFAMKI